MDLLKSLLFITVFGCLLTAINRKHRRRAVFTLVAALGVFFVASQIVQATRDVTVPATPRPSSEAVVTHLPAPTPLAPTRTEGRPGEARVCLVDDREKLKTGEAVVVPRSTVLTDEGPNTGKAEDPESWHYEVKEGGFARAALETLADVTLTRTAPCGTVAVGMLVSKEWPATTATADAHHLFNIHDVLDYTVPTARPAIEFGKLVDDIAVLALLTKDVERSRPAPDAPPADEATSQASCRALAMKLAPVLGASLGRQTHMMVPLEGTAARDMQVDCGRYSTPADLFAGWDGAKPTIATKAAIGKAGAFLTGLTAAELGREIDACVAAALKPDAGEMDERHYKGARIECQAFVRDGGGGSVTIYRRYGAPPASARPTNAEVEAARPGTVEAITAFENPKSIRPKEPDASTYFIDTAVHTTLPFYGCPSQEALDKVKAMLRASDTIAMAKAAVQGNCTALERGAAGTVQDHSIWHASTCLRQTGEPDCLWVPDAAIAKD